jgi:hypothetical protein
VHVKCVALKFHPAEAMFALGMRRIANGEVDTLCCKCETRRITKIRNASLAMHLIRSADFCGDVSEACRTPKWEKCIASDAFSCFWSLAIMMHRKRIALYSWKNVSPAMNFETFRQRISYNAQNVARCEEVGSKSLTIYPVPRLIDRQSRVLRQLVATL